VNRDLILSALKELSDPDFQIRAWSGDEPGVMASFVECVEALFDDSGLLHALAEGVAFSNDVDEKLRQLDAELDMVDDTQPTEALLSDPGMARVRETAKSILRLLAP